MGKLAFVFPGQGSQYIGMGKDFYDNFEIAKKIFNITNQILGYDLSDIIFNGNEEQLRQTEITQPAIYTISYIIFKILEETGIKPDYLAGHSLGEYVALTASGILNFEEGIKLVKKRGEFIKEACIQNQGGMIAVIGLATQEIEKIVNSFDNVEIANFNSPVQTVLSYKGNDEDAENIISQIKAKRVIKLNVSGPFHSSFMSSASESLAVELEKYNITSPKTPMIFNYSGNIGTNIEDIRSNIINQVKGSVKWVETIELMAKNGVTKVLELGPGKVLTGLNKKINRDLEVLNIELTSQLEFVQKS